MLSILNFEKELDKITPMKAEVNFSKIALNQLIEQFYLLLNQDCKDLEGVFFLKNRSPLMQKGNVSYVTLYKGKEEFDAILSKKEFNYNHFPAWQFVASRQTIDEIEVRKNAQQPFNFDNDKSFLVSAVRGEKHNWGLLVCFAKEGEKWNSKQKHLLESFTHLLNANLRTIYEKDRLQQKFEALQQKYDDQKLKIRQLTEKLNNTDDTEQSIKASENEKISLSCVFNWCKKEVLCDEVWLTIQGFKDGDKDPKLSKWEKITDKNMLSQVNQLFFSSETNKEE